MDRIKVMQVLTILAIFLSQSTAQTNPTALPQTAKVPTGGDSGAGGFPPHCIQILKNGGDNPYPQNSVARIYSVFCPVIDEFANCLEQHLNESTAEYLLILAKNFNKNLLVSRMNYLCSLIPGAAASLDTLHNSANDSSVQECFSNFTNEVSKPSNPLTLESLCGFFEEHVNCLNRYVTSDLIAESAMQVYFAYIQTFMPGQCTPAIPTIVLPTIGTPQVANGSSTSQTWIANSVVARCAYETYGEVIRNIMAVYATPGNQLHTVGLALSQAMGSVCQNVSRFSTCINQNLKTPYGSIDAALSIIINLPYIGTGLSEICSASVTEQELTCIFQSGASMPVCGSLISAAFRLITSRSSTYPSAGGIKSPQDLLKFCPILREGDTCARIQLQRCSPTLAATFNAVEKQLFTADCYNADSESLNASPYLNRMAYCMAPIMSEAYQRFASRPWTIDDPQMISFSCKESSNLATCLSREVRISKNLVDIMTAKMIDFSSAPRLQYIFNEVCSQKEEILNQSQCIMKATNNFQSCQMEQRYKDLQNLYIYNFVFNISGIDVNGVTALCKPYKKLAVCNARQISNCSDSVSKLAEDVVNELLRMDCGGSRPLTEHMNMNAATSQGTLKVTLMFCIVLLLNVIM